MSFADMKKRSKTDLSSLIKETEKISNPNSFGDRDEGYWRPELDKSGNGYAVIRFLPDAHHHPKVEKENQTPTYHNWNIPQPYESSS